MFDSFLNRLSYFTAKKGIKFFGPASGASIEAAERKLGVLFTNEMKNFWLKFNGCSLVEISIVGIPQLDYRRIPKSHDIVEINLNKRSFGFWPENCLELGRDGFGNFFVADTRQHNGHGEFPIYWIDHEKIGINNDITKIGEKYAHTFNVFLKRTLDEMIDLYNSDLTLKNGTDHS